MKIDNYRVLEYEWMVWKKTFKDTFTFYMTNPIAWIGNIISIATTLAYIYFTEGLQAFNNEFDLLRAGFFGIIGMLAFFIIVHRLSAPVILYRVKESAANIYNWKDVDIKPYYFPKHYLLGVGLKITNNGRDPRDFFHGCASIESIVVGQTRIYSDNLPLRLAYVSYNVDSPIFNLDPASCIYYRQTQKISALANWDDNQAWIYQSDNIEARNLLLEPGITYRIKITMIGRIDLLGETDPLHNSSLIFSLSYFKNNENKMDMKLELLERMD